MPSNPSLTETMAVSGITLSNAGGPYTRAVEAFCVSDRHGWASLDFFRQKAKTLAQRLDGEEAAGLTVTPRPSDLFRALSLTPPGAVRAVILGQDPYPTFGDAHGLSFSTPRGRALPRSLKTIFQAYVGDLGFSMPESGDLTPWARAGVLLLNLSLTTRAGLSQTHAAYGWSDLVDEVFDRLNHAPDPIVFFLWGRAAQRQACRVTAPHHIVLPAPHPSPLGRGKTPKGHPHPFLTHAPFLSAQRALEEKGVSPIAWQLEEL